jgi:hypothetical protein
MLAPRCFSQVARTLVDGIPIDGDLETCIRRIAISPTAARVSSSGYGGELFLPLRLPLPAADRGRRGFPPGHQRSLTGAPPNTSMMR